MLSLKGLDEPGALPLTTQQQFGSMFFIGTGGVTGVTVLKLRTEVCA